MALRGGADLVIELPTYFALSNAQGFARGAVCILDALQCVDALSFGAETADLAALQRLADFLDAPATPFKPICKRISAPGSAFRARKAWPSRKVSARRPPDSSPPPTIFWQSNTSARSRHSTAPSAHWQSAGTTITKAQRSRHAFPRARPPHQPARRGGRLAALCRPRGSTPLFRSPTGGRPVFGVALSIAAHVGRGDRQFIRSFRGT